jgi:hypothetical protein
MNKIKLYIEKLRARLFPYIHVRKHILTVNKLDKEYHSKNKDLEIKYKKEIEELNKTAEKVFQRVSKIDWRRDFHRDVYSMMLEFDPNMTRNYYSNELDFIAEQFGRIVSNEIRSCKFIEKAHSFEIENDKKNLYYKIPRY